MDYNIVTHKYKLLYDVNDTFKKDSVVEGIVINDTSTDTFKGLMVTVQGTSSPFFIPAIALTDDTNSMDNIVEALLFGILIVGIGYALKRYMK